MLSLIVCSRSPELCQTHKRNVAATIGCAYEYLRLDNRLANRGICEAYNRGVERAEGEILVFAHEDVLAITRDWGAILEAKFQADPTLGLVGLAGTEYLTRETPAWIAAGRPFIHGRVVHETNAGQQVISIYCRDQHDAPVVAVDGLFFAVRAELFRTIRFDSATFDRFHHYDLDICMQVRRTHRLIVTTDILVKHLSGGNFDQVWQQYGQRFLVKWASQLPATCASRPFDPSRHGGNGEHLPVAPYLPTIV